jgi:hypothetical protein
MLTAAWLGRLLVIAVVAAGGLVLVSGLFGGPVQRLHDALAGGRQTDSDAAATDIFPFWALLVATLLVLVFVTLSARAYFGPASV